jgi:16S rRNA (guanine966-N2)-methyltransferase
LFAGSGALGLEALSRGALSCIFVDEHRQAAKVIAENLAKARLEGGHPVKSEVISFLKRDAAKYELIFADPPYWKFYGDKDHVTELLNSGLIPPRLAPGGWFIAEISSHQESPTAEDFTLVTRREYGSSAILIYTVADAT